MLEELLFGGAVFIIVMFYLILMLWLVEKKWH